MAYTRHGHFIPASNPQFAYIGDKIDCGGPEECGNCKGDVQRYWGTSDHEEKG